MLAVMQLHDVAGNCRLEGFVAVRQIRKSVLLTGQTAHGPRRLPRVPQETSRCQHDDCSGSLGLLNMLREVKGLLYTVGWRMGIGNLELREWELI